MWILFALLAALTAAVVVTLSKAGIKNVPPSLAFAIQSVLILLVAWGTVLWQGVLPELARLERRSWLFLLAAGVLTGCRRCCHSKLCRWATPRACRRLQTWLGVLRDAGCISSEGKA
jgi:uncharacterized membrane protein